MKLDGKVALITGAASGIGHGIAKRYLEADGRVVIADLNADGAISAARELADQKAAIGIGMDVTKEDEVNAGVEKTVDTFGRIDILVSNAGIQIVHPIEEFPEVPRQVISPARPRLVLGRIGRRSGNNAAG